jgi:hypothetical protein
MMRKLVFAVAIAAVIGVAAGCKDDGPTSMKFNPAKAEYTAQQNQYTKGAATGITAGTTTP